MFKHRLKKAMGELGLNQMQVAGMTGKSKASVSQYLSGQQIPPRDTRRRMAEALGLEADYFERPDEPPDTKPTPKKYGTMKRITVKEAAALLGVDKEVVSKGLQQGVFPWGYAIKTTDRSWAYIINAHRLSDIEGVQLNDNL